MRLRHPYTLALLQLLTLYTTPLVYLYLDRFRVWASALTTIRAPCPPSEPS
jgi:multidrug efflux pump